MKIILAAGARPNFMKIAPLIWELEKRKKEGNLNHVQYKIVHTGQHYDVEMSEVFFKDLIIPVPDINLEVGSASHAVQTANIMIEFEKVCFQEKPDIVVVVGDVNSTIACTLVASKLGIRTAHVEAGLRSFDKTMPEETNRLLTDALCDYLFTTCEDANINLSKEGIPESKIYFVGNIMIDCLENFRLQAKKRGTSNNYGFKEKNFALLTLHRPSNVDEEESLKKIYGIIEKISREIPVIFPVHPRTRECLKSHGITNDADSIILEKPLGYVEHLNLMMNAKLVLTDSGGVQEETTVLKVPCLTLRENTERPITINLGTNTLVGIDEQKIIENFKKIIDGTYKKQTKIPPLWDGKTAPRIIDTIIGIRLS
ncbi:MAG: UDP-N-acetylglucosamine 2-epimerase (non-hydrolyzing) [Candidatus Aminicenantes bacterium]|nr:MAG: UDP-N-acetylglucosamine 2-epimerase (non-hydrolyzing) [Candidatus Aminicenantes bacterium]